MTIKAWLAAPFKFFAIPVSVLVVLIYGTVFTSVLVTDQTPNIPKDLGGLDLNEAYKDLHVVSGRPNCLLRLNDASQIDHSVSASNTLSCKRRCS